LHRCIVAFADVVQRPLQLFCLLCGRIQPLFVGSFEEDVRHPVAAL
jgi:hypothetical protein